MAGTLAPDVFQQFIDANGNPYASYKLYVYLAGTTTKVDTYSDVNLTIPNPNPLTLDAAGRPSSGGNIVPLFLTPGVSYKFVIALPGDTDPPTSPVLTQDNVGAVPASGVDLDVVAVAGEALSATDLVYLSVGQGGKTAGRWYKADADNAYASSQAEIVGFPTAAILAGASGTVRIAGRPTWLSGLVAGAVYYASATDGAITSTAPANKRVVGVADGTSSLILNPDQALRLASVVSKSANYTATVADDVIIGTGTWTLTLYAVSGNSGRALVLRNDGTGIITIDPNASETINGVTTIAIFPGETAALSCNGTAWVANLPTLRRVAQLTAAVSFSNDALENSLHSVSIPANTLGTNRVLRYDAFVHVATDAGGARNVNLRIKFGGSTRLSGNIPFPANQTHYAKLSVLIFESGATNAQRIIAFFGDASTGGAAAWTAIATAASMVGGDHATFAVDTTVAQTFQVTAQMDSAQVGFSTALENASLVVE